MNLHIGDRDLAKALNWGTEEALQHLVRDPLAVASGKRCPHLDAQRGKNADQVHRTFSILQSERLPE